MASMVATEPVQMAPARGAPSASPVGWAPSKDLDASEWASAGRRFGTVGRCIQWLIGDWISYGNTRFGERYARASKITGYDTQTLMNMVYVASRFDFSRRRESLSWSHHETLAALEQEDQDHWLDQATQHRWSVSDLRMMVRLSRREAEVEAGDASLEEGPADDEEARTVRCPKCGEAVPLGES